MDIAHDQETCMTGQPQGRADEAFTAFHAPLDWQDLRTRLFAAHEVRAVLGQNAKPLRIRLRGSFDGCAATALTSYEVSSRGVNPTASTNFKCPEGKTSPAAGESSTGGRG